MSLSPLGCYSILDTGVETQVKQIIVFYAIFTKN